MTAERLAAALVGGPARAPAPMPARPDPTPPSTTVAAGPQPPITRRPPFSEPYRASACSAGLYDDCTAEPRPDAASGATGLDVSVTSPAGGIAVGVGGAQASSEVVMVDRLARPAEAVIVTVTMLVRSASVERSVSGVPLVPLPTSTGAVSLSVAALHSVCGGQGCFVHDTRTVVDLVSAVRRSREEITLQLRLENPAGPVPAGDIAVSAGTYGSAQLGDVTAGTTLPDIGTVRASVDAVVTSITLST